MSDRITRIFERDIAHSVVVPGSRVIRSTEVAHVGGRPEIPNHSPTDVPHHSPTEVPNHSPTIELVTEANVVRAIDVTCACGQKMRLWCSYESDVDTQEAA